MHPAEPEFNTLKPAELDLRWMLETELMMSWTWYKHFFSCISFYLIESFIRCFSRLNFKAVSSCVGVEQSWCLDVICAGFFFLDAGNMTTHSRRFGSLLIIYICLLLSSSVSSSFVSPPLLWSHFPSSQLWKLCLYTKKSFVLETFKRSCNFKCRIWHFSVVWRFKWMIWECQKV